MKVQAKHGKVTQNLHGASRNYRYVWDVSLWEHHTEAEATWEREEFLRSAYPYLFPEQPNLEDEIYFKGGRFVTPWFLTPFLFAILFGDFLDLEFICLDLSAQMALIS